MESRRFSGSKSIANDAEVQFIVNLLQYLFKNHKNQCFGNKIGVITPYKRQYLDITKELKYRLSGEEAKVNLYLNECSSIMQVSVIANNMV